jgi:hypothetical protein
MLSSNFRMLNLQENWRLNFFSILKYVLPKCVATKSDNGAYSDLDSYTLKKKKMKESLNKVC